VKDVVSKFNFRATGGGRGGGTQVYRRRDPPKVPLDFSFPVIKGPNDVVMFEEDPEGSKRSALVNSPSKIAGVTVLAKRAKGIEKRESSNLILTIWRWLRTSPAGINELCKCELQGPGEPTCSSRASRFREATGPHFGLCNGDKDSCKES
jgi:hypothetical protein